MCVCMNSLQPHDYRPGVCPDPPTADEMLEMDDETFREFIGRIFGGDVRLLRTEECAND